MTIYANERCLFSKDTLCVFVLIVCWIAGLLFGYYFFEPSFLPLMRSAVQQPVSIAGLFVSIFFPLICSYFSFLTKKPIIIMIVCFLKAIAFGFTGALISHFFYTAGWLVCFFLMFSDCCFAFVLFILWLRYYSGVPIRSMIDVNICAVIGMGIAMVDYFVISPFLQGLI